MEEKEIKKNNEEQEEITLEEEIENPSELVKKIRDKLKKCETEKQEYLSGWQRAKADYINARREEESKRNDIIKFSEKKLLLELLSLADGFEMFSLSKQLWEKVDKDWRQGVEHLYAQMLSILKSHGVEQIKSVGAKFNPKEHESIGEIVVDKPEKDGIIMEEMRKGYKMHELVIRPSAVKVGKFNK